MPPKPRVTKENILAVSLNMIRSGGIASLNARAIAKALHCSTQPIFRFYATMEKLKADVIAMATAYYSRYFDEHIKRPDVPPYKATGLAYIQFAKDERELFKLLFMRDRANEQIQESEHSFDVAVNMMMGATGLTYAAAKKFHLEMWVFVHGIATMIATSYLDMGDEFMGEAISDAYQGLVQLYKKDMR